MVPVTLEIQISFPGNCNFHASGLKTISMCGKFNPSVDLYKNLSWNSNFHSGISDLGYPDILSWKFKFP